MARKMQAKSCRGFTMIEMFAVVMLISLLICLLLPAVQSAREAARRTKCGSQLSQIGLAVQGYHHAFDQLPVQLSGTDGSVVPGQDNDRRLSAFVAIAPFLDSQVLWERIQKPYPLPAGWLDIGWGLGTGMGMSDAEEAVQEFSVAGGPEPFRYGYPPWMSDRPELRCPSDPGVGLPSMGRTNYAFCFGDSIDTGDSGAMKDSAGTFVVDPVLAKRHDFPIPPTDCRAQS